ncbi:hypothetical protein BB561_000897 [Smittium simulii]|uniref:Uncharacterized protein n=1 Tax=Smittium simulii TaxID=133385 RepID=A0A2T9YX38_9FUNG|nr:hypothetical protein BB561_000897 [Smittium simulii]
MSTSDHPDKKNFSYAIPTPINIPSTRNHSQNNSKNIASSLFPASNSLTSGIHFSPPMGSSTPSSSFPASFTYRNTLSNSIYARSASFKPTSTLSGPASQFTEDSYLGPSKSQSVASIQRAHTPMGKMIREGLFLD